MKPAATHEEAVAKIEDSVVIDKPLAEVFAFYATFQNLPRFLGDVLAVESIDDRTSRWTIEGPLGVRVHWDVVITESVVDRHIFYETSSDALKTRWRIHFSPGARPGQTVVREIMLKPGGALVDAALTIIGKDPAKEIHHNLNRLKEVLETGRVTDRTNAVRDKFGG